MTDNITRYRALENGSIDFAYYDNRARTLRSEDVFKASRLCVVALRTLTDRLMAVITAAFSGPASVTKRAAKPVALHALAYVASSTGSSQSATAPSRPS